MLDWIKRNLSLIITGCVTLAVIIFIAACEPKVPSLWNKSVQVNRQELQLELDQLVSLAHLQMLDLDRQEQLRSIILQNALILVQGQPLNPVGIITGIAAVYGLTQGGSNVTKVVKNAIQKRKVNNGTA